MKKTGLFWIAMGLLLMVVPALAGDMEKMEKTIEHGDADLVNVNIDMSVGDLNIHGGSAALLEGVFQFNHPELKPVITYTEDGDTGELKIKHGSRKSKFKRVKNAWDLKFSNETRLNFNIDTGVGDVIMNMGDLNADRVDMDLGVGDVNLTFSGSPTVTDLNVDAGTGDIEIDLTGEWRKNLNASIDAGVGDITVKVPSDVGVRVKADTGVGSIKADGFMIKGKSYVNTAYETAEIKLNIDVDAGVGSIKLLLK